MSPSTFSFPPEVIEKIGYYIYAYIDPRDEEIFYIGKGKQNRAFEHLSDTFESKKVARIKAIKDAGLEPKIDILVYGLSENEALRVEAICIDLIGLAKLTNCISGNHSDWVGRISVNELITEFSAQPAQINHPLITININRSYFHGMSEEDLYEFTRGIWKVGERRNNAKFALAVYHGIVREVYEIIEWLPAGSTDYQRRKFQPDELIGRFEFRGNLASLEMRNQYVGKRIQTARHSQNPIRYHNC